MEQDPYWLLKPCLSSHASPWAPLPPVEGPLAQTFTVYTWYEYVYVVVPTCFV